MLKEGDKMSESQVIELLLNRENEISNKFHNAIIELLRLKYESDRGKEVVRNLVDSVQYSLEEIERIVNR